MPAHPSHSHICLTSVAGSFSFLASSSFWKYISIHFTMRFHSASLVVFGISHCMAAASVETHKTRTQLLKEGILPNVVTDRDLVSPGPP